MGGIPLGWNLEEFYVVAYFLGLFFFFFNLLESLATHLLFNNGKIKHIPLIFME